MKILFFILFIIFFSSCETKLNMEEVYAIGLNADTNMDWILGKWKNSDEGSFEDWNKVSEIEFTGHGFVQKNDKIVWEEHLKLSQQNGKWFYIVSGVNEEPTSFEIVAIKENFFIAVNEKNDFPKAIQYQLDGKTLKAKIWGGGPEVKFEFTPK